MTTNMRPLDPHYCFDHIHYELDATRRFKIQFQLLTVQRLINEIPYNYDIMHDRNVGTLPKQNCKFTFRVCRSYYMIISMHLGTCVRTGKRSKSISSYANVKSRMERIDDVCSWNQGHERLCRLIIVMLYTYPVPIFPEMCVSQARNYMYCIFERIRTCSICLRCLNIKGLCFFFTVKLSGYIDFPRLVVYRNQISTRKDIFG